MPMPMLRRSLALAALLSVWLPGQALAEFKIGLVDQRRGILSTQNGQEAQKSLEALADVKQNEMEPRQKEFQRLQEDLESQRFVLSQDVLEERALDLEQRKRELERELSAARDDLTVQERKMLRPVLEKWAQAVREIGQQQGFDVIIDRSTPGIVFSKDALDITELVVQRVDGMD